MSSGVHFVFQPQPSLKKSNPKMPGTPPTIQPAMPAPAEVDSKDEAERAQWTEEELDVLLKHLEEFKGKSKAERANLLNETIVPEVKKVYKGPLNEWKLRKQVLVYIFPCHLCH
jgi:hypothetical protein